MKVGLDTSVVVRLLIGTPEAQCALAWDLVQTESDAGHPVLVADVVVAEAFFVLLHHYAVPAVTAVDGIKALLLDPRIVGESAKGLWTNRNLRSAPLDFVDALIHQHYADARRSFVTFDRKASRLPDARLPGV